MNYGKDVLVAIMNCGRNYNGGIAVELRIDELRKQRELTWAELARKSRISKGVLSEIKNGQKRTLNPDHERKLAKAFGVTITELYIDRVKW